MENGHDHQGRRTISDDLAALLDACKTLPRPPGIAFRLIQRTSEPDSTAQDIAQVLASDPVLAGRIVGAANSPIYAQQGEVKSLDRAVTVLGFQATRSTALSFTLLQSLKASEVAGVIDHKLFWRRSLLTAVAGRALAAKVLSGHEEEMFLTCLLQDIGILAFSHAVPGLYDGLDDAQLDQEALIVRERERFGADHAVVGAWLVERWGFPEEIAEGVLGSHHSWSVSSDNPRKPMIHRVALASMIAEVFLERRGRRRFEGLEAEAERHIAMDSVALIDMLRDVAGRIPEAERTFEMQILAGTRTDDVIEEAAAVLVSPVPAP